MNQISRLTALSLIAISVFFLATHPLKPEQYHPTCATSDEGCYFYFAKTVSEKGIAGFQDLMDWYKTDPEALRHPKPCRIGYIILSATWLKLFGASFENLGLLSFFCFLLFLLVTFHFCKKHFNEETALWTTTLLSSSPLLLGMSRRALMDSGLNLVESLCAWLLLSFLTSKKNRDYIILIITLILCFIMKETSIILFVVFLIITLFYLRCHITEITPSKIVGIIAWTLLFSGLAYIFTLGIANTVYIIHSIVKVHLIKPYPNPYDVLFGNGPWHRYIIDHMLLSPVVTLLCIGYLFHVFATKKVDPPKIYFILYLLVSFLLFTQFTKNIRYVIHLETPIYLISILMLQEIFATFGKNKMTHLMTYAIVFIFILNMQTFLSLFYNSNLFDPVSYHLLRLQYFIPALY